MTQTRKDYERFRKFTRKAGIFDRWLREQYRIRRAADPDWAGKAIVNNAINWRAELWAEITEHAHNGKVGYIVEGMDCDCTQYRYEGIMDVPVGAFIHQREVDHHHDYLDGPESTYYVDPRKFEPQQYRSRDLALEAFEDGHDHVVYPGELEEI